MKKLRLNSEKVLKEKKRLGWTWQIVADNAGLRSRQHAYYLLRNESILGAVPFGKAFDIDPKDLLK